MAASSMASDGKAIPNMNCPGQEATSPFFYTLKNSTQGLDPSTPRSRSEQVAVQVLRRLVAC